MEQQKIFRTRKEVEKTGEAFVFPYSVVSEAYKLLHEGKETKIHLPHSDVYFVRAALESKSGYFFPLNVVEEAMRMEGWKEQRHVYLGKDL
jgi:c-di-GMP-binding flagellar brake protein YcgR